jgi:predicted  nucleic acid-binding Zn-ribbon protein
MQTSNKQKIRKIIFFALIGFVLLFFFRLMYGYTIKSNNNYNQTDFFESIGPNKRNIASKEYKIKSNGPIQTSTRIDQKYEKIAEINTKTSAFEDEERAVRKQIEKYEGLIQFEQKNGNEDHRKLNLLIGVPPENFDSLYSSLIGIGRVGAKQITKKDKTNEYKELNAKKLSLEKIRNSLIDLKSKGGKIDEYMQLENRILEIEQELQDLGVSLGNFDDENEFCTVQFSLIEGKVQQISFLHRLKVAFEWTIRIFFNLTIIITLTIIFAYMLVLLIDKLKLIEKLIKSRK